MRDLSEGRLEVALDVVELEIRTHFYPKSISIHKVFIIWSSMVTLLRNLA